MFRSDRMRGAAGIRRGAAASSGAGLRPVFVGVALLLVAAGCGEASAAQGGKSAPAGGAAACSIDAAKALALLNERRSKGGHCGAGGRFKPASPLAWNAQLAKAAAAHSSDMAQRGYFDHRSPQGKTHADRAQAAGYRWRTIAENIALGPRSVEETIDGWMASPGHCANILNPGFRDAGIACAAPAAKEPVWTLVVGASR